MESISFDQNASLPIIDSNFLIIDYLGSLVFVLFGKFARLFTFAMLSKLRICAVFDAGLLHAQLSLSKPEASTTKPRDH